MKRMFQFIIGVLLLGLVVLPTKGAYTSLYIFGDGISTTTNNPSAGQYYYGLRRSNGRVWVEVLAQRLGLGANSITNVNWSNSTNNWSYYGQYSPNLVVNLNSFKRPTDAATALFVVWVNNADFVGDMGNIYPTYGTSITQWTNAINQSLSNHWQIITNLYYAKGARTFIMPNAVDITEIPQYDSYPANTKSFIRNRVIDFNTAFSTNIVNRARTSLPGITIYEPDFFALLDNILTNATTYGLTNVLSGGVSIDAVENLLQSASINGPGTNYIFWDTVDPTAKLHEIMADVVQQLISPVQIGQITALNGSNRLDVVNVPAGLNGYVDTTTNLSPASWTSIQNITSTNTAQSVFVAQVVTTNASPSFSGGNPVKPADSGGSGLLGGPPPNYIALQFYRLRFPYAWNWP
jgi:phospholipase/lecithinase/hemolysin